MSFTLPPPCQYCRTMQKHNCRMQPVCSEVKSYYRRFTEHELNAQAIERAYRIQKIHSRKYKGGAM